MIRYATWSIIIIEKIAFDHLPTATNLVAFTHSPSRLLLRNFAIKTISRDERQLPLPPGSAHHQLLEHPLNPQRAEDCSDRVSPPHNKTLEGSAPLANQPVQRERGNAFGGGGTFGQPANATAPTNAFGGSTAFAQPPQTQSAFGGGTFGAAQPQQQPQASSGGLFGNNNTASAFGKPAGTGVFGTLVLRILCPTYNDLVFIRCPGYWRLWRGNDQCVWTAPASAAICIWWWSPSTTTNQCLRWIRQQYVIKLRTLLTCN